MNADTVRVGRDLRAQLRKMKLSQKAVAAELHVTQPRISRVLKGEFTKRSKLALRLCERYSVEPANAHKLAADDAFETATGAFRELWDGTPAGAQRLTDLISAIRSVGSEAPGE